MGFSGRRYISVSTSAALVWPVIVLRDRLYSEVDSLGLD